MNCFSKHCGVGTAAAVSVAVSAVTAAATVMLLALCKHSNCDTLCDCLPDDPCAAPPADEP